MNVTKIECLHEVVRRGYFSTADADVFGKAAVMLSGRDIEALGIAEEDAGHSFYRLHVFDLEPEVEQAARELNFCVTDKGAFTEISLI